jgi:hypothetical protein
MRCVNSLACDFTPFFSKHTPKQVPFKWDALINLWQMAIWAPRPLYSLARLWCLGRHGLSYRKSLWNSLLLGKTRTWRSLHVRLITTDDSLATLRAYSLLVHTVYTVYINSSYQQFIITTVSLRSTVSTIIISSIFGLKDVWRLVVRYQHMTTTLVACCHLWWQCWQLTTCNKSCCKQEDGHEVVLATRGGTGV